MLEMNIESIRVSLATYQRVVILRVKETNKFLPIWIGPAEADSIAMKLQDVDVPRPMTHDLLNSIISSLGATVSKIVVSDLNEDTFYAKNVLQFNGTTMEVDSRPSDAIALAGPDRGPHLRRERSRRQGGYPDGRRDGKARGARRRRRRAAPGQGRGAEEPVGFHRLHRDPQPGRPGPRREASVGAFSARHRNRLARPVGAHSRTPAWLP